MIAVTGATGEFGRRVASHLAKLRIEQRLIVRDLARAPNLSKAEVLQASSDADAVAVGRAFGSPTTCK